MSDDFNCPAMSTHIWHQKTSKQDLLLIPYQKERNNHYDVFRRTDFRHLDVNYQECGYCLSQLFLVISVVTHRLEIFQV